MHLKNVSARAYGIMGKIYAPLETFELTDEVAIASIQPAIDAGDMVVVESKPKDKPEVEAKPEVETESDDAPRRGRKPKADKEAE